jgi:3-oxo-5-alpha-steroid 4-dehydrogenase 1
MITQAKFNLVCIVWIAIALLLLPLLFKVKQPYGKHATNRWGPMISNNLGWFLMELPALLVFCYFLSMNFDTGNLVVLAAGFLWCLHYIHRAVIFPFLIRTKGKKMPVLIVFFAICFNSVNGFINGYWLSHFSDPAMAPDWTYPRVIFGMVIFLAGFAMNKYHDTLLIQLRKDSITGYRIPYKGMFGYVSCPNYLGEIISWTGFLIVTLSLPALAFLTWSIVNLVPRAIDHHKWYKKEFPDYPEGRKAIFPFIL